jgi:hypothetical protein
MKEQNATNANYPLKSKPFTSSVTAGMISIAHISIVKAILFIAAPFIYVRNV